MRYIKCAIILFFSLILVISCTLNKEKNKSFEVQVQLGNKLDSKNFSDKKGEYYSLEINLINNTDSIIEYVIYSCSWDFNIIFNNSSIRFSDWLCDSNAPICVKILPGERKIYKHGIHVIDPIQIKKQNDIRLGFILVRKNEFFFAQDFFDILIDKIKNRKDVIWSNAFELK